MRNNNQYYLLEVWRNKVEFPDLCTEIVGLAAKFAPNAILIEDHGSGTALIAECKRRGMTGIIGRQAVADKRTRMNGETAKLQAGSLILVRSAPYIAEFVPELRAFPGGKHDDQVDALSQLLMWRTEAERRQELTWEMGYGERGGAGAARFSAPSPEEMLRLVGR